MDFRIPFMKVGDNFRDNQTQGGLRNTDKAYGQYWFYVTLNITFTYRPFQFRALAFIDRSITN